MASGAPFRRARPPAGWQKVTVEPSPIALENPGAGRLRVLAHYEKRQGARRDPPGALPVERRLGGELLTSKGRASLLRRGETDLVVRYQSFVVPARVTTVINPELELRLQQRTASKRGR